jgi:hypothetical protein
LMVFYRVKAFLIPAQNMDRTFTVHDVTKITPSMCTFVT